MADSNANEATYEFPSDEEVHEMWRRLTDNGKLDGRVQDAEKLCRDFLHTMDGRYALAPKGRRAFEAFAGNLIANIKADVVSQCLRAEGKSLLRRVG